MDHKQIVKQLKHYGCVVTDLDASAATIKLTSKTKRIVGVDTDLPISTLKFSPNITYVVGSAAQTTDALIIFCKALRDDLGYNVIYDGNANSIIAGA